MERFTNHLPDCSKTSFAVTLQKPFNTSKASPMKIHRPPLEIVMNENSAEAELKTQLNELLSGFSETDDKRQFRQISMNVTTTAVTTISPAKKTRAGERYSESTIDASMIPKLKCKTSRVSHPISLTIGNCADFSQNECTASRQITSKQPGKKELDDDISDAVEGIFEIDHEIKEAEPGGKEGIIPLPRITQKSLPHFAKSNNYYL